jgi:hypothetical protein
VQLILRYLANALNCLYFDGDARGLEPFVVQENILFECWMCNRKSGENLSWFLILRHGTLELDSKESF